jgi:hypothetical protein
MITKTLRRSPLRKSLPLLSIPNVHVASCGEPPKIDATGKYLSYFENSYGEQWVFIGDAKKKKAVVYGGDIQWTTEVHLTPEQPCPKLFLNEPEKAWLLACWTGFTGDPFQTVVDRYNAHAKTIIDKVVKPSALL